MLYIMPNNSISTGLILLAPTVRLHATILSGRFWQIICARSSTYRDLNVSLKPSALSSVYIIVFCVQKVFKNFTTQEKSLNREKNLWFVYRFFSRFFES